MKFTVEWSRRALDAIAKLWLDHSDQRSAITQAIATIDQLLQFAPENQGESRDDDRRILFVPPLVVIFRVDIDRQLARILDARHLKRRGIE